MDLPEPAVLITLMRCTWKKLTNWCFPLQSCPGGLPGVLLPAPGAARRQLLLLSQVPNKDSVQAGAVRFGTTTISPVKHSQTLCLSRQGVRLLSLPRILCLNLKRFRRSRLGTRKLDCEVTFPESFDFSQVEEEAFAPGVDPVMACTSKYVQTLFWGFFFLFFFIPVDPNIAFVCGCRLVAATLCTRWWCTLDLLCADTTPPSSDTPSPSSGTTQMIVEWER